MAHQLIDHYFNTSKSYRMNIENDTDSWVLIVEKVNSVSFLFDVSDLPADEEVSPTLPMARKELGPGAHHCCAPRSDETLTQEP